MHLRIKYFIQNKMISTRRTVRKKLALNINFYDLKYIPANIA